MRQFLLAGNVAYGGDLPLAAGAVAFTYLDDGKETIDTNGTKITDKFYINLGREANGPVVLPAYKKHLTFVKGVYQPATTFSANLTIGDVNAYSDYSIMIVKKGLKFNERNRWTATIHTGLNPTAKDVAKKLANQINNNTIGHGIKATVDEAKAKIILTAESKGIDYEILGADELVGIAVTVEATGFPAYGDAAYITDLANKAAADAGIEYTYRDTYTELYPTYPLNPLKQPDSADAGYTIFTLRFAVPREMKTRDEVVHQIVQIAFPTGATATITTVENILKAIATEEKA